jgi:CheY-like chemotaxis protein
MSKKVLDVGQCPPDHNAIKNLIEDFGAEIRKCDNPEKAIKILKENKYDLVLVNRKIDMDYSDGIELLRRMKSDPEIQKVPVMLISNDSEYQKQAIAEGAEPGFGKDYLSSRSTKELLANYL